MMGQRVVDGIPPLPEPADGGHSYTADDMKAFGFQCHARGRMARKELVNPVLAIQQIGTDGEPYTPERLIAWLDAKYRRHGEEEDQAAANMLRVLTAAPGRFR